MLPIYVISLTQEIARRRHITNLLSGHDLEFEFVNAIDTRNLSIPDICSSYLSELAYRDIGRDLSAGEIGCALSHWSIYKKIIEKKIPAALIMEDDVEIQRPINSLVHSINNGVIADLDWHVLMLCYYRNTHVKRDYILSSVGTKRLTQFFSARMFTEPMHSGAAYFVSYSGACRLNEILSCGFGEPLDHYLGSVTWVNTFGVHPRPIDICLSLGFQSSLSSGRALMTLGDAEPQHHRASSIISSLKSAFRKLGLFSHLKSCNIHRFRLQRRTTEIFYFLRNYSKRFQYVKWIH